MDTWFTVTLGAGIGRSGFDATEGVPTIFPLPPGISPTGVRGPPLPTERGPAGDAMAGEPFCGGVGGGALEVGGEVLEEEEGGAGEPAGLEEEFPLELPTMTCMLRILCCMRRLFLRRVWARVSWMFCFTLLQIMPTGQLVSVQFLA